MLKRWRYCFDFRFLNSNMLFLSRLENGDFDCLPNGQLIKGPCRHKKRIRSCLETLFYCFLYEIRAPLEKETMTSHFLRKKELAGRVLGNLRRWTTFPLSALERELARFEKNYYLRQQLVQKAESLAQVTPLVILLQEALQEGITPMISLRGYSGTWIMRDRSYRKRAVFKPFDEEIGGPNNPTLERVRGALGLDHYRKGIAAGSAFWREEAVYQISERLGLHVVPETIVASLSSPCFSGIRALFRRHVNAMQHKIGSLQLFVEGATNFSSLNEAFIRTIPEKLLHPLFILDMIVGHGDRHGQNILWDGAKAWAIDNGFALSPCVTGPDQWRWRDWSQARLPVDEALKELIYRADALSLGKGLESRVAARLAERLAVIQEGLKAALSPYNIASCMTESSMRKLEGLERTLYERARQLVAAKKQEIERGSFWPTF